MKSMHIDAVANFPFPTPPDRASLKKAETILTHLGALDSGTKSTPSSPHATGRITDLGRAMSLFPVSPRFSKILVSGRQHGTLPYAIALVAIMSIGSPFLREDVLNMDASDDDDHDSGDENANPNIFRSEEIMAKEKRKLQRRRFFRVQHVCAS